MFVASRIERRSVRYIIVVLCGLEDGKSRPLKGGGRVRVSWLRLGGAGDEQQQLCGRRLGGRFLLTNSFIKKRSAFDQDKYLGRYITILRKSWPSRDLGINLSTSLQLLRNGHRDGETPRVTVLEYSGAVLDAASRVCSFSHCKHISVPASSSKSKP